MLYKFNNIAGRIVRSGTSLGQGLKPGVAEPAQIIYESPKVKFAKITSDSQVSRAREGYGEVPAFLKQKMELFQADNNVPVHLKGGTTDKVLFGITVALCAVGLFESARFIFESSFPKKEE